MVFPFVSNSMSTKVDCVIPDYMSIPPRFENCSVVLVSRKLPNSQSKYSAKTHFSVSLDSFNMIGVSTLSAYDFWFLDVDIH